ncbi:hypothetical protein C8F01DRAFT_1093828 [Mycena amicta]|nr:hypothetical protein C8F01DRAFT_1093828 [Mycena amicta]
MSGANSLCTGVKAPKVETVEKLWGLKKTTPSMIAGATVWLRWVHSRDEEFLLVGDVTTIDWAREFDAYIRWDEQFYPNSDEGIARQVYSTARCLQGDEQVAWSPPYADCGWEWGVGAGANEAGLGAAGLQLEWSL